MLFSVIIPTFNRRALLETTLESVQAQRFTDYEIIVVDDGSTDDTIAFLESKGIAMRVLRQENRGPGAARNLGAANAHGDYLAFLDSDDVWFPWTLSCFAELIQRHEHPAILGAKLVPFTDEAQLAAILEEPVQGDVFPDYFGSHAAGYFVGAGMSVLRRKEFMATGGYTDRPINSEDHDLILRMGVAKGFVQVISPPTLGWRRHAGSATMNTSRTAAGNLYLIEQEHRGAYPGGKERSRERHEIITRRVRPVALECLRRGMKREARALYRATFRWHLRLGRWKFLAGFPLKTLFT